MKAKVIIILVLIGSAFVGAAVVLADCSNTAPADGETVTCTSAGGTETNTVGDGSQNNVTVNVEDGAVIDTAGGDGIYLGDNATVNNNGTIQDVGDGIYIGANGEVTNNGLIANSDIGIEVRDTGTNVTNNGIINQADDIGIYNPNGGGTITNNGTIQNVDSYGIYSVDNTVVNNGSVINNAGEGIAIDGDTLTNNGTIGGNGEYEVRSTGNQAETFINNAGAAVNGTPGVVEVYMEAGSDTVQINTNSTVTGIIDGGTAGNKPGDEDTDTDVLIFETNDPNQLDALANQLAALSPLGGTLNFNGNEYVWQNFEELRAILTIIAEEVAASGGGSAAPIVPNLNEIACANVKVFKTADGYVQVYSGFEVMAPNGFLVAVFPYSDAASGDVYSLDDANTPAWSVQIMDGNMLNVLNESGAVVGTCNY